MDPKIWGKAGWKFLFSIALGFPQKPDFQKIHNYTRFFNYLQYVLPCEICRLHYASNLNQITIDPYMTSRDNLFLWVLKMHNLVNKQIGKPPITRADVIRIYFDNKLPTGYGQLVTYMWEKDFWKFSFSIAYGYPRTPNFQDIFNYKRFFTYVQYVLPCINYRKKYCEQFTLLPIDPYLTTTEYLFDWIMKMHNQITQNINLPLKNENDVIRVYFGEHFKKEDHLESNYSERPANGIGLIEGFTDGQDQPIHVNLNDSQLLNKNLSLAVLILVVGLVVYRGSS